MRTKESIISLLEFKRLVIELAEKPTDICFRFRLMGQMWHQHFLKIVIVHENALTLLDESTGKLIFIPDLTTIMQFELDKRFQSFQPHFHYQVFIYGELHFS